MTNSLNCSNIRACNFNLLRLLIGLTKTYVSMLIRTRFEISVSLNNIPVSIIALISQVRNILFDLTNKSGTFESVSSSTLLLTLLEMNKMYYKLDLTIL